MHAFEYSYCIFGWEGLWLRCNNWKVQHTFTHGPWHMDCWQINRRRVLSLHKWRYENACILLITVLHLWPSLKRPLSFFSAEIPQEFLLFVLMLYGACCRYHIFQGNVDKTIHMSDPHYGDKQMSIVRNSKCSSSCVAPVGTAKSLTCALFLLDILWISDPHPLGTADHDCMHFILVSCTLLKILTRLSITTHEKMKDWKCIWV